MTYPTKSDRVADDVAADPVILRNRPVVRLCGYVKVTYTVPPDEHGEGGVLGDMLRLYTSTSFDRWVEIPTEAVVSQIHERPEDEGRSIIWVVASQGVTQSQNMTAEEAAHTLASGIDDPTAYPKGPRGLN